MAETLMFNALREATDEEIASKEEQEEPEAQQEPE